MYRAKGPEFHAVALPLALSEGIEDHVVGGDIVVADHLVPVWVRIMQGPMISLGIRDGFGCIVKCSQHPSSGNQRAVSSPHVARHATLRRAGNQEFRARFYQYRESVGTPDNRLIPNGSKGTGW